MSNSFNGAANTPPSSISTRAELLARLAARQTPKLEAHLTPRNWDAAQVHRAVNDARERRITALQDRLENARKGMATDHSKSRLGGHARADFGRAR